MARLEARVGRGPREREPPCDPGVAEKLTAEVFGHGRADDLAHWRGDGGATVAIEREAEVTAFAYRRGERVGDPTLFMASRPFGRPELSLPSGPILY